LLITLKEILQIAEERKIAVGAFNAPNFESLQAILQAAEELELSVILQFAQCHEIYNRLEDMGPLMVEYAKRASVPVCVHLDHGETLDYLQKALDLGFTGIMYDGSTLSYRENMENTRKAVAMAAQTGASVEAELGCMGKRESGDGETGEEEDRTKIYTDPMQAAFFVDETGIDALACSFGTTHGIYLTQPKLDFSIVRNTRRDTGGIPIVMHGGSGVSREDFREAIRAGVRKINYYTYMDKAAGAAVADYVKSLAEGHPSFFADAAVLATKAMKENVKEAMKMFGGLS
jgi:fructose-bisphosphate aldolase class II